VGIDITAEAKAIRADEMSANPGQYISEFPTG
jgi:hypothetical protein